MEKINMYFETLIYLGLFIIAILLMIYAVIGSYNLYLKNQLNMRIELQDLLDLLYVAGISFLLFYVSISALKSLPKGQQGIKIEIGHS